MVSLGILTKGRPLFVEGRLDFDQWTGQDGTKRSKHRVTVEIFQFIGSPGGAGGQERGAAEPMDNGSQVPEPEMGNNKKSDDIPF